MLKISVQEPNSVFLCSFTLGMDRNQPKAFRLINDCQIAQCKDFVSAI
jgi:hypothetical protein